MNLIAKAPWNTLMPRTIPFWKDYVLTAYKNAFPSTISTNTTVTEDRGINIQGTSYQKVDAPAGDSSITISHFKM